MVQCLLWVDSCRSRRSVTLPAWQPAKLAQTAELGQKQSFRRAGGPDDL
jgi:hypothetical protein